MKNHIEKGQIYKYGKGCLILAIFFWSISGGLCICNAEGTLHTVACVAFGIGLTFIVIACGIWWHMAQLRKKNPPTHPTQKNDSEFERYL